MIVKENTGEKISSSSDVVRELSEILELGNEVDRDKEHFWIIGLNTKNAVKFIDLVSLGTLSASIVRPREVFRLAVMKGTASIIAGRNQPNGDPAPSSEDVAVTERLKEAGDILGITLLDHVIVGYSGRFVSLKDNGVL